MEAQAGILTEEEQKAVQEVQREVTDFSNNRVLYSADTLGAAIELRRAIDRDIKILALLHSGEVTALLLTEENCDDYEILGDYGYSGTTDAAKKFLGQT